MKFTNEKKRKKHIVQRAAQSNSKSKSKKKEEPTPLNTCAMYENCGAVATVEERALLENIFGV